MLLKLHLSVEIMAPPGMEEMTNAITRSYFKTWVRRQNVRSRKLKIKDAFQATSVEEEAAKMVNQEELKEQSYFLL